MADGDDKVYKVEFKAHLDVDDTDWEPRTVVSRVKKGTEGSLFVDNIVSVTDDSDGLLQRSPEHLEGKTYVVFDATVDKNKVSQLVEDGPPFEVTVEVEVNPDAQMQLAGALAGLAGGLAVPTGKARKIKVKGKTKVEVEFPHPYIWHPFINGPEESIPEHSTDASAAQQEILVDTDNTEGTLCKVRLRKFVPDHKKYEDTDEELDIELVEDDYPSDPRVPLDHLDMEEEPPLRITCDRVVIGEDELPAGKVKIKRDEENEPVAKNQPVEIPVRCKTYKATLGITVELEGEETWDVVKQEVKGEEVTLAWPDMDGDPKGKVKWEIIEGPRRIQGEDFVRGMQEEELDTVELEDGTSCPGVKIQLVLDDPITKDEVRLPAQHKRRLKWEIEPAEGAEVEREGDTIAMAADGESKFTLKVKVQEWDEQSGDYRDAEDEDKYYFSYWLLPEDDPLNIVEFFGYLQPWPIPQSQNPETVWGSKKPLPDSQHPQITLPTEGVGIRVRAWDGPVTRSPGAIDRGDSKLVGEQVIPVVLGPVKVRITLKEPAMPIPADGKERTLTFALASLRTTKPVKNRELFWGLTATSEEAKGKVGTTDGKSDENGELKIQYTPPELTYKPGGSFSAKIEFYYDEAHEKSTDQDVDLLLAPRLKFRVSVEKKGLEFKEPALFDRLPDGGVVGVKGRLALKHEKSGKEFTIHHGRLSVAFGDDESSAGGASAAAAGEGDQTHPKVDEDGVFTVEFPELKEMYEDAVPAIPTHEVRLADGAIFGEDDPVDSLSPLPACKLAEEAKKAIEDYDKRVESTVEQVFKPKNILEGHEALEHDLLNYSETFYKQLAENEEKEADKAISATFLLAAAAAYSRPYINRYEWRAYAIPGRVGSLLASLFELLLQVLSKFEVGPEQWLKKLEEYLAAAFDYVRRGGALVQRFAAYLLEKVGEGVALVGRIAAWIAEKLGGWVGAQRRLADVATRALEQARVWGEMALSILRDALRQLRSGSEPEVDFVTLARTLWDWLRAKVVALARSLACVVLGSLRDLALFVVRKAEETAPAWGVVADQTRELALLQRMRALFSGHHHIEEFKETCTTLLGKLIELKLNISFEHWLQHAEHELDAAEHGSGGSHGNPAKEVDAMGLAIAAVLPEVLNDATNLHVPEQYEERIERFRELTKEMFEADVWWTEMQTEVDEIVHTAEMVVWGLQVMLIAVVVLCPPLAAFVGLAAASEAAAWNLASSFRVAVTKSVKDSISLVVDVLQEGRAVSNYTCYAGTITCASYR